MVQQSIIAKAPANTMLFGEHSILREGRSIVAALDCWLSVQIQKREDSLIQIFSSLGNETTSLSSLSCSSKFRFIEAVLRLPLLSITTGLDIIVHSDLNHTVGLGSSAAITVALLSALFFLTDQNLDKQKILEQSILAIRSVQGQGSGADVAASIFGGVIAYHAASQQVEPLTTSLPLVLQYSGKKTPTPQVIEYVQKNEAILPSVFAKLFASIDEITEEATMAIQQQNFTRCGFLMNSADGLMQALGVGTPELSHLCWQLRALPKIYGAKISGSGLGDSVVALGSAPHTKQTLPSTVSPLGVSVSLC